MLDLIILTITFGINFALAVLILVKNRKSVANKIFIIFIFSVLVWIVANFIVDHAKDSNQALFWSQISWIMAALALYLLFIFSLFFPFKDQIRIKFKIIIPFILTLIFSIFCLSDLYKKFILYDIIVGEFGVEEYIFGPFFIYGSLFFILMGMATIVKIFSKYRKVRGVEKMQIRYFLLGLFLLLFFSLSFSLPLPFLFNNSFLAKLSPFFSVIFVAFTTYAIVRHRLMDIRLFIQKTILYAMTFGLFLVIYLSLIFVFDQVFALFDLAPTFSSIISAVLIIAIYPRFKLYFQKKTDKFFYRYPYDSNKVLKEINEKCSRQIDFDNFFDYFSSIIENKLKINKILLVILQKDKNPFLVKNHNFSRKLVDFFKKVKCPTKIYEYFNQYNHIILIRDKQPVLQDILKDKELLQRQKLFEKSGVNLILPVYCNGQLTAFFFFGHKLSQEDLYPQDLQLFENLIDTLNLIFENIFLYNDLKKSLFSMEEKINQRTKELRELNKNQSRFMADISHELQTPLAVLKGNLSLINNKKLDEQESKKVFVRLERSVDRLSNLIKDLIFLSKADVGQIKINKEYFDFSDLVKEMAEDSAILAEDKEIKMQLKIEKGIYFMGDKEKLQGLLFNLISNALKYTPVGKEIKIELYKKNDTICLLVADQGIGIARKDLPYIFSRFYRIEYQVKEKGTGLGLAICKWIVHVHGGKIGVKSELGKGTSFKIILPLS